jgi:hypothetical protein
MNSTYIRCEGCVCTLAGGPETGQRDWVYTASSSAEKPCNVGENWDCKCFVLAQRIRTTSKVIGQSCITGKPIKVPVTELIEEKIYSGSGKAEGGTKPLTRSEAKSLEDDPLKGEVWGITAACLALVMNGGPCTTDEWDNFIKKVGEDLKRSKKKKWF